MTSRIIWAALAAAGGLAFPAMAEEIHRNSFSGKTPSFVKGDDNVKAEEKVHELSADRSRTVSETRASVLQSVETGSRLTTTASA